MLPALPTLQHGSGGENLRMMRARRKIPLQKSWELEMGSLIHFRDHYASIQVFGYWDHWEKAECRGYRQALSAETAGAGPTQTQLEQLQNVSRRGNILISFRKQNKVVTKMLG